MRINITSGELLNNMLKKDGEEFIPFNEAMEKGKSTFSPFSEKFIEERIKELNTTTSAYLEKMNPFLTFIKNIEKYDFINLYFGYESFCQKNKICIFESLKYYGYKGKIKLHTVDEKDGSEIFSSDVLIDENIAYEEGYIPFREFKTYYRIVNVLGKKTPLLFLHGGPGSTHNSFELFDHIAYEDDRPFIMYDQVGCGKSSIPKNRPDLWVKETWVEELETIRKYLNLEKVNILGHSWGGMLNIIYNCDYSPKGINSLILSSTLSSASLWAVECHRLINEMPIEYQKKIKTAEDTSDYSTPDAIDAINEYYHEHVFGPWKKGVQPECLTREKPSSKESYETAWGRSEFTPEGTLKDYEYTDKLHKIEVPVMFMSGLNDESTPLQNKIMLEKIGSKKKEWNLFSQSRHMSYYEEHDLYASKLKNFLDSND